MAITTEDLRKKYEDKWHPENYLEDYVTTKNPWEPRLIENLHEIVNSGKIKGPRGIDIGCGPTVHRMSILARVCEEVLACDYTPSNVEFVTKFLEGDNSDELISTTLQSVARLEGFEDLNIGEKAICERLRSKVKHVVRFDLTNSESVSNLVNYGGQFDCAHSNGVLESACLSYEDYVAALKNVNTLLKPGAAFILSGYLNGNYYDVNGIRFECMKWNVDFVKRGLKEAGFQVDSLLHFTTPEGSWSFCNCVDGFSSVSYKL